MFKEELKNLIKGSFPLIHVNSKEYDRAMQDIVEVAKELEYTVTVYDTVNGYRVYEEEDIYRGQLIEIEEAITNLCNSANTIMITRNLNLYWEDAFRKPRLLDSLYNLYQKGIKFGVHLINISLSNVVSELSDYFTVVDYKLPNEKEIYAIVSAFCNSYELNISEDEKQTIVNLCKGMSKVEIENSLVLSYLDNKKTDINLNRLKREKANIVKKSGLLEWIEDVPSIEDIGGLDNLKGWFKLIAKVIKEPDKAKEYGLQMPKGCLLCGIPGTGKTLSAKAIASLFGLPLFRLDVGRLFGSLVGETEKNTRELFKVIDAMSPCVVIIDEIEKALSGLQSSGHTDSGITARVIGSFLYYLQEKRNLSYFVCTANNIDALPPELLRKGRFDEIWYVGLPSAKERYAIWNIHLSKTNRDFKKLDYKKLVHLTSQFTGAEIETVISQTLYKTFYEEREPETSDFVAVINDTTPFATVKKDYIARLEEWAVINKVRKANISEILISEKTKRRIAN